MIKCCIHTQINLFLKKIPLTSRTNKVLASERNDPTFNSPAAGRHHSAGPRLTLPGNNISFCFNNQQELKINAKM